MLTQDDALLCFTSEEAMRVWDPNGRTAVVLPGPVIAQVAAQAEVNYTADQQRQRGPARSPHQ